MRRAFTDRNTYLGDPAFVRNPIDRLLSKQYAADLRRQIGERASPTPVFEPAPRGRVLDHPLLGGRCRRKCRQLHHYPEQQLWQRGDGDWGGFPAER